MGIKRVRYVVLTVRWFTKSFVCVILFCVFVETSPLLHSWFETGAISFPNNHNCLEVNADSVPVVLFLDSSKVMICVCDADFLSSYFDLSLRVCNHHNVGSQMWVGIVMFGGSYVGGDSSRHK